MLTCNAIYKSFGKLAALRGVDLEVGKGEIVALIGPNGAGKTTLVNIISGVLKPDSGKCFFNGNDITKLNPAEICHLGIARTFQTPRVFSNMTVLENVLCGATFGRRRLSRDALSESLEALKLVGLVDKADLPAHTLMHQDRRRLELARALATKPKLLLIDEYMAGLSSYEVDEGEGLLKKLRDEYGITILWVEHVIKAVMKVADRVVVLHRGTKIAEGNPVEVAHDSKVIEAYLGEEVE